MNERRFRIVLLWNVVLTALLLVSLAGNALWAQAAADPPIQVAYAQLQDVGGDYGTGTSPVSINSNNYAAIATASLTMGAGHSHVCFATGSAYFAGASSFHTVGIALDDVASPPAASLRSVDTSASSQEVTTVQGFNGLSGTHTFYLVAKGTPAVSAYGRGLIVICMKKQM